MNGCGSLFAGLPLALGHIRPLKVSSKAGEMVYELSCVDLGKAPSYIALSYSWDGQLRDQTTLCNGLDLNITSKILNALPYLYRKVGSHSLWIDGVCINQDNIQERNTQVPLMRNIYTNAAKVWRPSHLKSGDTVCIFWGEHTPVTLCQREAAPEYHELIGESYDYEIKDGNASSMRRLNRETFTLN